MRLLSFVLVVSVLACGSPQDVEDPMPGIDSVPVAESVRASEEAAESGESEEAAESGESEEAVESEEAAESEEGQSPCARRSPTLETLTLPASLRVYTAQQHIGTAEVSSTGVLTFDANNLADEADVARARAIVDRIESDGHVSLTYTARTRDVRARCAFQVDRGAPGFAAAVRGRLRDSFDVSLDE